MVAPFCILDAGHHMTESDTFMAEAHFLAQRARLAKQEIAFHAGETDRHPHGISGLRFLTPDDGSCWDTHPRGYDFSEWGNAAGMVR